MIIHSKRLAFEQEFRDEVVTRKLRRLLPAPHPALAMHRGQWDTAAAPCWSLGCRAYPLAKEKLEEYRAEFHSLGAYT